MGCTEAGLWDDWHRVLGQFTDAFRALISISGWRIYPAAMDQPTDMNEGMEQLDAVEADGLYPEEDPEAGLSLAAVSAFHPAANIFPLLTEAELSALAEDIKANGLAQPVVRYKGQIIDGRNRYLACQRAEVEATFVEWQGEGSPVSWVLSMNLRRRQLTDQQRAMVAARAKAAFLAEKPSADDAGKSKKKEREGEEPSKKDVKKATMKAAELLGVSKGHVERASVVVDKGDESLVKVTSEGKVPLNAAVLVAALPQAEQKKIVEAGEVKAVAKRLREEKKAQKKAEPTAEQESMAQQSSISVELYEEGDALVGRAVIAGAELELTIRDMTAVLRFVK